MKRNIYSNTPKSILIAFALVFFAQIGLAQFTVSGLVETPNGNQSTGLAILVSGTENKIVYTNSNGEYSFTLQAGGAYNIQPLSCEENSLNGVTTYDMVLITRHYEGVENLDSPYKIIAADLDNSNSLGLQDTSIIRNLILGIINEFPSGNNRFVLKNYVFPDPLDPFSPAFPESYSISNLQSNLTGIDFIQIKKGDVNNTAIDYFECNGSAYLPAKISGRIFQDENSNCLPDTTESGMKGWSVSAIDGTNSVFYGTSNANGAYEIRLLPGTYDVVLSNPAGLWGACLDTIYGVQVSLESTDNNFGLEPVIYCSNMQVDLSTASLRRCFPNYYKVQYCNTGTLTAENAHIEITFDPLFDILGSTLQWSAVNGDTYTFELGDVPAGACDNFRVSFNINCDAVLGQTHCTEAQIFPDTICDQQAAWNGAELRVKGQCVGNEVKFTISNQGADMQVPSNYIVVEDIIVMTPPISNPFTLQGGNQEVITFPSNGATWRLEAEQPVGYPWGTVASATVEGCGTNATGDFSIGFVNQFPPDDQSPVIDIDCRENIGSYDPNDKQGFPVGVLAEHYIPLEQPIEYLIRFQNTGTDTAFSVVIRDTLDTDLDIASIRPLGGSHDYTFHLLGQNVAQFVFANILLPDSNINEAASHGYIKFSIAPKKGLSNGTLVENQAAIFFDFNEPVITNKTWHTLGEKYLDVSNVVFSPGIGLEVFPNPATDAATFLLKSASPVRGTLTVFDMSGREVSTQDFEHNQFIFNSKDLQAGCYFFKITSKGQALAAGKLVVTGN